MMADCEPWPLIGSCLPSCWSADPEEWSSDQASAVRVALAMLRRATAGVYGLCRTTLRPCRRERCRDRFPYLGIPLTSSPWTPVLHDGQIYNISCGCEVGGCGCGPICEVPLDGPVYDVLEVKVDGVALDPDTYWVDNNYRLVRRVGYDCFPNCQDMELPDTEPGTWSVTYRRGSLPGADGELALTLLAVEVDKLCRGDRTCTLPKGTTRISREGVDIELVIPAGRTGIRLVDNWIESVNPYKAAAPMRVYSPDTVRGRRRTDVPANPGPGPEPERPLYYEYHQLTPSDTWIIVHNLGFKPGGVQLVDADGNEFAGEVSYPSLNVIRIEFNTPKTGTAILS